MPTITDYLKFANLQMAAETSGSESFDILST